MNDRPDEFVDRKTLLNRRIRWTDDLHYFYCDGTCVGLHCESNPNSETKYEVSIQLEGDGHKGLRFIIYKTENGVRSKTMDKYFLPS